MSDDVTLTVKDDGPFGPVIYAYTAEQGVEDGIFVDVSKLAKEAGFVIPVRITRTVHDLCEDIDENDPMCAGQSYTGRLWDVLFMAHMAIRKAKDDWMTTFKVSIGGTTHELWACLDGTSGPAIHIMKPEDY